MCLLVEAVAKRITLASAEEVSSFVGKVLEEDDLDLLPVQVLWHEPW
jgi:hypothetical protein